MSHLQLDPFDRVPASKAASKSSSLVDRWTADLLANSDSEGDDPFTQKPKSSNAQKSKSTFQPSNSLSAAISSSPPQFICEECERIVSVASYCGECALLYCSQCDRSVHSEPELAGHLRKSMTGAPDHDTAQRMVREMKREERDRRDRIAEGTEEQDDDEDAVDLSVEGDIKRLEKRLQFERAREMREIEELEKRRIGKQEEKEREKQYRERLERKTASATGADKYGTSSMNGVVSDVSDRDLNILSDLIVERRREEAKIKQREQERENERKMREFSELDRLEREREEMERLVQDMEQKLLDERERAYQKQWRDKEKAAEKRSAAVNRELGAEQERQRAKLYGYQRVEGSSLGVWREQWKSDFNLQEFQDLTQSTHCGWTKPVNPLYSLPNDDTNNNNNTNTYYSSQLNDFQPIFSPPKLVENASDLCRKGFYTFEGKRVPVWIPSTTLDKIKSQRELKAGGKAALNRIPSKTLIPSHVYGYSPLSNGVYYWKHPEKSVKSVINNDNNGKSTALQGIHAIYTVGPLIVNLELQTGIQKLFALHSSDVMCLAKDKSGKYFASGQRTMEAAANGPDSAAAAGSATGAPGLTSEFLQSYGSIRVWEPQTMRQRAELYCQAQDFYGLQFSNNGEFLIALIQEPHHAHAQSHHQNPEDKEDFSTNSILIWKWRSKALISQASVPFESRNLVIAPEASEISTEFVVFGGSSLIFFDFGLKSVTQRHPDWKTFEKDEKLLEKARLTKKVLEQMEYSCAIYLNTVPEKASAGMRSPGKSKQLAHSHSTSSLFSGTSGSVSGAGSGSGLDQSLVSRCVVATKSGHLLLFHRNQLKSAWKVPLSTGGSAITALTLVPAHLFPVPNNPVGPSDQLLLVATASNDLHLFTDSGLLIHTLSLSKALRKAEHQLNSSFRQEVQSRKARHTFKNLEKYFFDSDDDEQAEMEDEDDQDEMSANGGDGGVDWSVFNPPDPDRARRLMESKEQKEKEKRGKEDYFDRLDRRQRERQAETLRKQGHGGNVTHYPFSINSLDGFEPRAQQGLKEFYVLMGINNGVLIELAITDPFTSFECRLRTISASPRGNFEKLAIHPLLKHMVAVVSQPSKAEEESARSIVPLEILESKDKDSDKAAAKSSSQSQPQPHSYSGILCYDYTSKKSFLSKSLYFPDSITSIAFSSAVNKGNQLYIGFSTGELWIFNYYTMKLAQKLILKPNESIDNLLCSSDGRFVAWNQRERIYIALVSEHQLNRQRIAAEKRMRNIDQGDSDEDTGDIPHLTPFYSFAAHSHPILYLQMSENSEYLMSIDQEWTFTVFHIESGQQMALNSVKTQEIQWNQWVSPVGFPVQGLQNGLDTAQASNTGESNTKSSFLNSIHANSLESRFSSQLTSVITSPSRQHLISALRNGEIRLFTYPSYYPEAPFNSAAVPGRFQECLTFSPCEQFLFSIANARPSASKFNLFSGANAAASSSGLASVAAGLAPQQRRGGHALIQWKLISCDEAQQFFAYQRGDASSTTVKTTATLKSSQSKSKVKTALEMELESSVGLSAQLGSKKGKKPSSGTASLNSTQLSKTIKRDSANAAATQSHVSQHAASLFHQFPRNVHVFDPHSNAATVPFSGHASKDATTTAAATLAAQQWERQRQLRLVMEDEDPSEIDSIASSNQRQRSAGPSNASLLSRNLTQTRPRSAKPLKSSKSSVPPPNMKRSPKKPRDMGALYAKVLKLRTELSELDDLKSKLRTRIRNREMALAELKKRKAQVRKPHTKVPSVKASASASVSGPFGGKRDKDTASEVSEYPPSMLNYEFDKISVPSTLKENKNGSAASGSPRGSESSSVSASVPDIATFGPQAPVAIVPQIMPRMNPEELHRLHEDILEAQKALQVAELDLAELQEEERELRSISHGLSLTLQEESNLLAQWRQLMQTVQLNESNMDIELFQLDTAIREKQNEFELKQRQLRSRKEKREELDRGLELRKREVIEYEAEYKRIQNEVDRMAAELIGN